MNVKRREEKNLGVLEQGLIISLKAIVVVFVFLALASFVSANVTAVSDTQTISVKVEDGYGNGVSNANTVLYYQDPDDGWGDASAYTASSGYASLTADLSRPFVLKAFISSPYQAYGVSGGYCGEGLSVSANAVATSFVLYPNSCASSSSSSNASSTTSSGSGSNASATNTTAPASSGGGSSASPTTAASKYCKETDAGNNKYTQGKNTIYNSDNTVYTSQSDYCYSSSQVAEFTCDNTGGWDIIYESCPSGYACSDGACIQQAQTACSDSDGSNIYSKGTAKGLDYYLTSTISTSDSCTSYNGGQSASTGSWVIEEECLSDGRVTAQYYECPSGYSCKNGACTNTATERKEKYCKETDAGNNKFRRGTNTIYNSDGSEYTAQKDYCYSGTQVAEFTCASNGGWDITYESCPSGYACSDGACVQATTAPTPAINTTATNLSCTETDIGADIYTKGKTAYGNDVGIDSCLNSEYVQEYFCYSYEGRTYKDVEKDKCPAGYKCSDGACVPKTTPETPAETPSTPPTPPTPTSEENRLAISLAQGWNMFGIPFKGATVDSDCSNFEFSKIWSYDADQKNYVHPSSFEPGVGYWFKASDACTIKATGYAYTISGKKLSAGWNQIGSQTSNVNFNELEQACTFTKGPWAWNARSQRWQRAAEMQPGEAYFVKVDNACTLGGEEIPPLPE